MQLDAVLLPAAGALLVDGVQQGFVGVVAKVAVELAVAGVTGVALVGAPHLFGGDGIAPKAGDPLGGVERAVDVGHRRRLGEADGPVLDEAVDEPGLGEHRERERGDPTLGQPDAARPHAAEALVGLDGLVDLRLDGALVEEHRHQAVGGPAGHQLEPTGVVVVGERAGQITPGRVVALAARLHLGERVLGGGAEGAVVGEALEETIEQRRARLEVAARAIAEVLLGEHVEQRRAEAEGERRGDAVALEPVEQSAMPSKSQSSSRKNSCSGWFTHGRCPWRARTR
jgi:hypothetical protein